MHVLMLGAGAMGSLLGARLAAAGIQVSLLSTNKKHIEAVRQNGLLIEELDGTVSCHKLSAFDDPRAIPDKPDFVMVTVKTHSTEAALASVRGCVQPSAVFLTLQNGIGNWECVAAHVGKENVLAGVVSQGVALVGAGRVRCGGEGKISIGEPGGAITERARMAAEMFCRAGLKADVSGDMQRLIWEKLMVNTGINAITALTGIRNGVIADCDEARDLCKLAVREALQVAEAKGFSMPDDIVERVFSVAKATAVNRSSMGQDVDRKKRTEIEAINGAIVRFGEECGILTPVNRTLARLVKVVESGYLF